VDIHTPYAVDAEKCVDLAIQSGASIRIQHMTFDKDLSPSFIQKIRDYGFHMIPTIMVFGDPSICPILSPGWIRTQKHI